MTLSNCLPGARLFLLVGVTVLVWALALLAWSSWKGTILPGEEDASPEEARQAALEQKFQGITQRARRKQRVAEEVLAGRLTLLEAAALFRALDHGPPEFHWGRFRASWPGKNDDERHCQEAIHWVYLALRDTNPGNAEALRQDLNTQLSEHQRLGPLRLCRISELPPWIDD
jgi:hypothetical protein